MFKTSQFIGFFLSILFGINLAWANLPYFPIQLPRDDAAHYENTPYLVTNMMEWWYYNGKITSKTGRHFGFYLSFNYIQREINGKKVMLPFFAIQLADIDKQKVYGKRLYFFNKNAFSLSTQKLDIAYGKNIFLHKMGDIYQVDISLMLKDGTPLKFALEFQATKNALLASKMGLIDMEKNTNSYYYSLTRLATSGYFQLGNEVLEIDSQQSLSWMDHQWGDFLIGPLNSWMWASIQLENGMDLDLLVKVDNITKKKTPLWANIIMPDNSRIYITHPNEFEYHDHPVIPKQKHPLTYDLKIPLINLDLNIHALVPGQDVNFIWEGMSSAEGTFAGKTIHGQANTENNAKY